MLLWNGLLVLFVLRAGFPWNMAGPQLHLLSLTVKKLWCQASYFTLRSQNLQYKAHPEFWPSHRRIFKTSLYYKTRLILGNWRYVKLFTTRKTWTFGIYLCHIYNVSSQSEAMVFFGPWFRVAACAECDKHTMRIQIQNHCYSNNLNDHIKAHGLISTKLW